MEDIDYGQLQELLGSVLENNNISFEGLVQQLQAGDFSGLKESLGQMFADWLAGGGGLHLSDFSGILLLVFLFAILRIVGQAFESKAINTFSGLVVHLLLIAQLAALFRTFQEQVKEYLDHVITFSSALLPVLAVTSAASGETLSAAGLYASAMSICSLVSRVCMYVLLPGVSMFLVITLLNSVMEESLFSGFTGLLKKLLGMLMKTSLAVVTGMQILQVMILPRADSVRKQTLLKTASLIPGAGGITDTAVTVLWESGSLLKGSIGVVGMFCILIICLFPVLRIALVSVLYHVMSAVMKPAADEKICSCLSGFAESLEYLVKITCLCGVILLILMAAAAW